VAAAIALACAIIPGTALGGITSGTCAPTKTKFINDPAIRLTTSTTFVNLPSSVVNFVQGGASASCVIVQFSAAVITSTNAQLTLRATLDGVASSLPDSTPLMVDGANFETRSAVFVFPSVTPGAHTVRIQFLTSVGTVEVSRSNVVVQYAP
jgi:hypothetical protein